MTSTLNWPLIISAGGSQLSHEWYSQFLKVDVSDVKLCQDQVAAHFNGFVINVARPGSSSRRIMRRTLYECITQLKVNPGQKIFVIMELSFDVRKEIWIDGWDNDNDHAESNFLQIQLSNQSNWWNSRGKEIDKHHAPILDKLGRDRDLFESWIKSQRYFHSSESESINLLMDLVMMTSFFREHNIGYCVFRGNPSLDDQNGLLVNTFRQEIDQDSRIMDLDQFSFTGWCVDQGFRPLDYQDRPELGHPSLDAHKQFATAVLIPALQLQL